jgi:hypothetical protein
MLPLFGSSTNNKNMQGFILDRNYKPLHVFVPEAGMMDVATRKSIAHTHSTFRVINRAKNAYMGWVSDSLFASGYSFPASTLTSCATECAIAVVVTPINTTSSGSIYKRYISAGTTSVYAGMFAIEQAAAALLIRYHDGTGITSWTTAHTFAANRTDDLVIVFTSTAIDVYYNDRLVDTRTWTKPATSGSNISSATPIILGIGASGSNTAFTGALHLIAHVLDNKNAKNLSKNPWQIFQKDMFLIPFGSTTATLQYLAPISDLSTGGWSQSTGPTLYAVLDESVADDSDYISTTAATTCELKLGNGIDPLSSTGHILKYRILTGTGTLSVALKQGSTTIASWVHTLTGLPQDISNTLSGAEADSITNYTNLRVTFTSS